MVVCMLAFRRKTTVVQLREHERDTLMMGERQTSCSEAPFGGYKMRGVYIRHTLKKKKSAAECATTTHKHIHNVNRTNEKKKSNFFFPPELRENSENSENSENKENSENTQKCGFKRHIL